MRNFAHRFTAQINKAIRPLLRTLTSIELAKAEQYAKKLQSEIQTPFQDVFYNDLSTGLFHYLFEATDILLMDGSFPVEIDEAMVNFGFGVGPYENQDILGLDRFYHDRQKRRQLQNPERRYIPIADRMVEEGRLGRSTNVGWYRYPGGKGKVEDPLVEDLVSEESHFAKIVRTEFAAEEIQERVICALINASADRFAEFPNLTIFDLDWVINHRIGFPIGFGGLIFYANQIGLDKVAEKIAEFAQEDHVVWKLSPSFSRLRM